MFQVLHVAYLLQTCASSVFGKKLLTWVLFNFLCIKSARFSKCEVRMRDISHIIKFVCAELNLLIVETDEWESKFIRMKRLQKPTVPKLSFFFFFSAHLTVWHYLESNVTRNIYCCWAFCWMITCRLQEIVMHVIIKALIEYFVCYRMFGKLYVSMLLNLVISWGKKIMLGSL